MIPMVKIQCEYTQTHTFRSKAFLIPSIKTEGHAEYVQISQKVYLEMYFMILCYFTDYIEENQELNTKV